MSIIGSSILYRPTVGRLPRPVVTIYHILESDYNIPLLLQGNDYFLSCEHLKSARVVVICTPSFLTVSNHKAVFLMVHTFQAVFI